MKITIKEIQLLLLRLSIALLIYPVCKTLFFIFNHSYFSDVSVLDFLAILFFGLRFDISALILMNIPFILLHIIPFAFTKRRWYTITLKAVFLTINSIAILANCVDLEYYKYTLKRTTADFFSLFGLGDDISTLLPQYAKDFWYVILIWIVLTVFISYLYRLTTVSPLLRFSALESGNRRIGTRILSWFAMNSLLVGVLIIGYRGGLQLKPIFIITASEYVSAKNIPLILNTPFSIIKSYGQEELEEKNYFSESELKKIFTPIHQKNILPQSPPEGEKKYQPNVFVIILESFSKEYTSLGKRKSYTPFLDSLMNESLVFENGFANGKKSIEGIPAVIASIPALMNESYITSVYGSNQITSIPNCLKQIGYSSAFFHGGTNGTMGFDAFCNAAGFDNYFGRTEYNNEKDYDGNWGIWDEEFLQYSVKETSKMKEPFLSTVFTLSSHHPYPIPLKCTSAFEEGTDLIHKGIQYTDYSLKKFFEEAKKEKWFDNTLFVITSDHTGPSCDLFFSNSAGYFQVPVMIYRHNSKLKGRMKATAQQADILPTVLDYTGYSKPYFSFGNTLLDTVNTNRFAVNMINDVYQIFQNEYMLQFDGNNSIGLYDFHSDSLLQNNLISKQPEVKNNMENKLKAIIQTYHHALIHNKMTAD